MKTFAELEVYYETEIKPGLTELEKQRIRTRKKTIVWHAFFCLLTTLLAIFIIWALTSLEETENYVVNFVLICIFCSVPIIPISILWKDRVKNIQSNNLRRQFKTAVIGKIIKLLADELVYSPDPRAVGGEEFLGSAIFPHIFYYPTGYWAEDFVEGRIGETNVRFYEIDGGASVSLKQGSYTAESIPFHGLFFIADFNKSFNGITLVLPKTKVRKPQWVSASGRERMIMDDPEFETQFFVYGTDQITARYILSTALMKRITDYKKKAGRKIYLSFMHNKVYIAIDYDKNMFEMNLYRSLYTFEGIKEYYSDLRLVIDIVDDLNLNTRIWLKDGKKPDDIASLFPGATRKRRKLFIIFAYALGFFGVHNFYAGYYGRGLLQLFVWLTTGLATFLGFTDYDIVKGCYACEIILNIFMGLSSLLAVCWPILVTVEILFVRADSMGRLMV